MNTQPIGVLDSGIGGLTTVKKLVQLLPGEDIIYLGDTNRIPYGSRPKEEIIEFARQDAAFLTELNIKAMVIACNTVSSAAFDILNNACNIPVFETITPSVKKAVRLTENGRIGVIGTTATINSGIYKAALQTTSPRLRVFSAACPRFVEMVENDRTDADDEQVVDVAEKYLAEIRESGIDTLILGCTHFPMLTTVISKVVGEDIKQVDSGSEAAVFTARALGTLGLLRKKETGGTVKYFVTGKKEIFSGIASRFMGSDISGAVETVELK